MFSNLKNRLKLVKLEVICRHDYAIYRPNDEFVAAKEK